MKTAILPIIQRLSQLLVGDPGVLDGVGRVGVAELSLNRRDIAGFLDEVPAHGVGGVALDAGQGAHFFEHRIDHSGVETAVAVGAGISKWIDFILYFHDNAHSSAQKKFPIHRLIV